MNAIANLERKTKITAHFNTYSHSKFSVREITQQVFNNELPERTVRMLLLDLCDRSPHTLKSRKALRRKSQVYIFWKNYDAQSTIESS